MLIANCDIIWNRFTIHTTQQVACMYTHTHIYMILIQALILLIYLISQTIVTVRFGLNFKLKLHGDINLLQLHT